MQKNLISRSLALVGGALLSSALMAKPPNILVIMSDDVGWQNVSAYSHGVMGYNTPVSYTHLTLPTNREV